MRLGLVLIRLSITLRFKRMRGANGIRQVVRVRVGPRWEFIKREVGIAMRLLVVFVFRFTKFRHPRQIKVVSSVVLNDFGLLTIFPFFLLTRYGQSERRTTVLLRREKGTHFFGRFLTIVICMGGSVHAAFYLVDIFGHGLQATVTYPLCDLNTFPVKFDSSFSFLNGRGDQVRARSGVTSSNINVIFVFLGRIVNTERDCLIGVLICFFDHGACAVIKRHGNVFSRQSVCNWVTGFALRLASEKRYFRLLYDVGHIEGRLARGGFVVAVRRLFGSKRSVLDDCPGVAFLRAAFVFFEFVFLVVPTSVTRGGYRPVEASVLAIFVGGYLYLLSTRLVFFFIC